MSIQSKDKSTAKIPLRIVLIVPFVIQVILIIGLVGYISFINGQQAVNNVAHQLLSELTHRIEEHLYDFLTLPHQINRINANAIRQGLPPADDPAALERYFWEQIQVFDSVTSIYFGNPQGGLANAGREGAEGSLYVIATDGFESGPFRKYATDDHGHRTELLVTVPDFDARTRGWYAEAVAKGDAAWSEVYILFTGQDMAISASRPVYDAEENLLGVAAVDIFASHINEFLKEIQIGETGVSFIIERSGLLVASSADEAPFTAPGGDEAQRRIYATESAIPIIRRAAEYLTDQLEDYHDITEAERFEFKIARQRYFLQVAPVQDEYGVDWLAVVVIPESDFMAQIHKNNRTTALIVSIALLAAIGLGIVTAQWVTRPILCLNAATRALAKGEWEQPRDAGWISEIDELAQSFAQMAGELKATLEGLASEIAERKQVEAALRESERKYRTLIEQSHDAIYLLYEGRFEIINPRFTELFGVTPEEVRTPSFDFMTLVAPQSRPLIEERERQLARGQNLPNSYEFTAQDKGGHKIEVEVSVSYMPYRDGTATQGILRDVTERKRLERQLRRHERLAAVGQLAAGIAHDFRNLLSTIILYAGMGQREPGLSPKLARNLKTIIGESRKAADMVQQILDFSGRAMVEMQPLDLKVLTQEVTAILRRTIPEHIHLDLKIGPDKYIVHADAGRIQQALMNLALNAHDAMPDGGELRFELSRLQIGLDDEPPVIDIPPGAWICLVVADTGMGMSEEVQAHLFEPFFTTKEVGQGTGLGLAQVFGIVRHHEGYINVETEVGRGTTFRIYLPASEAEEESGKHETHTAPQGRGELILLVEDNARLREAGQDLLELLGYRTLSAANGIEALAVYETNSDIALVITDVIMPKMGGKELVQKLRSTHPHIKALAITGYADEDVVEELRVVGFQDVIHKPFAPDALARVIRRALDARR
ncbi:MAG: PAS domain S-box protein [Anaerolineales bacterium]